jgi:dTDP-4-dehydrorhamnose 3,5-epimerase
LGRRELYFSFKRVLLVYICYKITKFVEVIYKSLVMKFTEQDIKGVWIIQPERYGDYRGYFMESFKAELFKENVGDVKFIQDNESVSSRGVLRGLHFQRGEYSQAKLVRVSQGRVIDVIVDLRKSSPTYGQYRAYELSQENGTQLFIPRGFAHGFIVLSDVAQFQYKVDNVYAPQSEATLKFDDVQLGINWPLPKEELVLSPKDLKGLPLSEIEPFDL